MRAILNEKSGFTLVELLVAAAILGIALGAIYSLYLTNLRSAYKHDDVVEVQQNLRIAMDALTRDIKMAGVLIPLTATDRPLSPGAPIGAGLKNYSTSVTINTVSPDGALARVTKSKPTIVGFSNFSTNVDSAMSISGFHSSDAVRLVRPFNNSQPLSGSTLHVSAVTPATPSMTVDSATSFTGSVDIRAGDVFAKAAGTGPYDSITYSLVTNSENSACPVNQKCLARSINGALPAAAEIVAGNISSLRFSYLYDVDAEDYTPDTLPKDPGKIRAVRVTITGVTTQTTNPNWSPSTRQVTSVIKLRNRRTN
jgi:prepilin-type N-terminal cleavage/methylation domain-containing protein